MSSGNVSQRGHQTERGDDGSKWGLHWLRRERGECCHDEKSARGRAWHPLFCSEPRFRVANGADRRTRPGKSAPRRLLFRSQCDGRLDPQRPSRGNDAREQAHAEHENGIGGSSAARPTESHSVSNRSPPSGAPANAIATTPTRMPPAATPIPTCVSGRREMALTTRSPLAPSATRTPISRPSRDCE